MVELKFCLGGKVMKENGYFVNGLELPKVKVKSKSQAKRSAVQTNSFVDAMYNEQNENSVLTENGAKTNASSKSAVLDFFALGGALRNRDAKDVIDIFTKALSEDRLLAFKVLFYLRDIRGGQGERRTFRIIVSYLASHHPELLKENLHLISEFGRWDDIYCTINSPLERTAFNLIGEQLKKDNESDKPSLLAKWVKSENTSSPTSRAIAKKLRKHLGWSSKAYRKTLSALRKKLSIIETKISNKEWSDIDYSKVPSKAVFQYKKAFWRNDGDRYAEFLGKVETGEAKLNTGTLYPYDIVRPILYNSPKPQELKTLDVTWKNLPNYVEEPENSIVVADVSASMTWEQNGLALAVCLSLAIYFAERNEGAYKDHFITFTNNPTFQKIQGVTLEEKIRNLAGANIHGGTNLQGVFDLILSTSIKANVSKEAMPKRVYIISDMEFDQACYDNKLSNFKAIDRKYKAAGYERPNLVFWNVNARSDQTPVVATDDGTFMVSGCSPSIFKSVMASKASSPYDMMMEVLNQEKYSAIKV